MSLRRALRNFLPANELRQPSTYASHKTVLMVDVSRWLGASYGLASNLLRGRFRYMGRASKNLGAGLENSRRLPLYRVAQ